MRRMGRVGMAAAAAAALLTTAGAGAGAAEVETLHGTVQTHERFCQEELFSEPQARGVWNLQIAHDRAVWSLNLSTDGRKDVAYGGFHLPPTGADEYGYPPNFVVTVDRDAGTVVLRARVAADCGARGYDTIQMTGAIDRGGA